MNCFKVMEQRFATHLTKLRLNWGLPPENWQSRKEEIHCWAVSLCQPSDALNELSLLLSPDEIKRAAGFRVEHARRNFVITRGTLRQMLSHYTGVVPTELAFIYGAHGKPSLAPWLERTVHFNVSHSGELALFAISHNCEVGVDVELLLPIADAEIIADRFFAPDESARIRTAGRHDDEMFYRCWTRREAILKCTGEGIGDAMEGMRESFCGAVCELSPAGGYAAALATTGSLDGVQTWSWPMEAQFLTASRWEP
jgi:4'-phosphopantetheinyl transferase